MAEQTLTTIIKEAYSNVKAESGIPLWLFPEHSMNRMTDAFGEDGLLRIGRVLGPGHAINAGSPATPPDWKSVLKDWPYLGQFGLVMRVCGEVAEPVVASFDRLRLAIDPMVICRSLAVLMYAPLVDEGKHITAELAGILGGQVDRPADLIMTYAQAAVRGDIVVLGKVDKCIAARGDWVEWASMVQEEVRHCHVKPRLIAVTPSISTEMVTVLADMLKEEPR